MTTNWRFSKGNYLTLLVTSIASLGVLSLAYHQHHYSEILSGVIGGLTIITGIVTAEWLGTARAQVETTRGRCEIVFRTIDDVLYNAEFLLGAPESSVNGKANSALIETRNALEGLAFFTRWPQPNAKKIRNLATELDMKLYAMMRDAIENGHLWSGEKRFSFRQEFGPLYGLVVGVNKSRVAKFDAGYVVFRETPVNKGVPKSWATKTVATD